MKHTIFPLIFLLSVVIVNAQKGKVTSAKSNKDTGKLDLALTAIREAIDPNNEKSESTINWPSTYETLGEIYQAIFQSKDPNMKKLESDPLTKALDAYKKALSLDEKNRITNSVKIKITLLNNDLTNQAVEAFNKEDFNKALLSFEQILEIQSLPVIKKDSPNAIDTVIIFNAGLAAYNARLYDKAIKYYTETVRCNYNQGRAVQLLAQAYQSNKDTVNSLKILQEGIKKYPEDNGILVSLINIYLFSNKMDEAMKYLDLALIQDPKNASYYSAKGKIYDGQQDEANAIKNYETAISLQPGFFDANYNLGVLYYNKGVKQLEIAVAVPSNENVRYEAEMKKANIWFEKSLPIMEKSNQIKPDDKDTLEALKNLYYRLNKTEKYNAILEKLGQKK
jgi:tetratricopeptide (TPR) repeat protein